MNKIFKTKYDVTTGQTKVVSELASNRQIASSSKSKPKCGAFWGNFLGIFKFSPLALLMSGMLGVSSVSYADIVYIDMEATTGAAGVREKWSLSSYWKNIGRENILIAPVQPNRNNQNLNRYGSRINTNVQKSVIIGPMAAGRDEQVGMTVLGHGAVGYSSQTTAIGNNVYAGGGQATAIGSDVMAAGYASIAIGNDDILSQGGYADALPQDLIMKIYGYDGNHNGKTTYKDILERDIFVDKYGKKPNQDHRHYSPTYSAGIGAIAIGSRSVAYGDTSLSLGTLSFALAKGSTAVGVRAFVSEDAEGGVAIGDESRVFAANSFAIGNEAEATNKGAISYGSGSKAVGEGSIAIGTKVASNAKIDEASAQKFRTQLMKELGIGTIQENKQRGVNTIITTEVTDLKTGNQNEIVKSGFANHLDDKKINDKISKVITGLDLEYQEEGNEFLSTTTNGKKKSIKKKAKEGQHAVTIGYYTINNGDNTVAIGTASYVKGQNSVVLGALNNVGQYASNTIAIGVGTNVHKENSIALGTGTTVTGAGVVAIGSGVGVTKDNTIAMGYGALGESSESIVLGNSASIKDQAKKSIVIGNGAKVENQDPEKDSKLTNLKWSTIGDDKHKVELEMSAIAIGTGSSVYAVKGVALGDNASIGKDASSSIALGNETKADMMNSVALGYRSTTNYFYDKNDANKSTAVLSGKDSLSAMELDGYVPEGSSYKIANDTAAGIISVGGWDNGSASRATGDAKKSAVGLRRIVNVAPGALDSDVATVGQLKALNYVKREGLVVYYTEEDGKPVKLVKKEGSNEFYKVDTKTGEPLQGSQKIDASKVLIGAKGANESIDSKTQLANIGDKIRFGHLAKGEISATSDQAITGAQLDDLNGKLGLTVKGGKIEFDKVQFDAVNVTDSSDTSGVITTFEEAIRKSIAAINRGYKFDDGTNNPNTKDTPFYLGSTIVIKAGDVTKKSGTTTENYLGKNLKTEFKNDSSKATFTIGLKEDPSFKKVTIEDKINDSDDVKLAVNKEYVDNKLKNVSTNLHFLSVQGMDKNAGNYNNDGAKGTHSVAIGVGAGTESGANAGIAIGHNAQSKAENAVVIGRDVSIDVKNSFVLGSNNTVTQTDKDVRSAVVVIGSGTKLENSKSSIAIGAVFVKGKNGADGTLIENAAWTASIGNKNKIKNGTDIVALGNNIQALDTTGEAANNGTKNANTELILIGNASKATSAKESVIIGAKAEAELKAKQAVIIGHSAKAETNAVGAVAIGQGATVKTDAGNSIALGQGSEAIEKKEVFESTELTVGQNSLKISWNNAGTGKNKSVVSVGKVGAERLITNVAAGKVDRNSTDAINGGQLFSVIETFGKLGVEVLGAEVDNGTKEFKKSSFDKVNYHGQAKGTTDTFRDAINESITAINKGFKFGDGTNQEQLYLGSTIIIQEGDVETDYKGANLKTKYEKDADGKVTLKIGMTESPTFKKVTITDEPTGDDAAVNKKYLDGKIQTVNATVDKGLSFQGNDGQSVTKKFGDTLKIVGEPNGTNTGILTRAPRNITVKKKTNSDDTLEIGLSKDLTGIESISNSNTQITLKDNKIELTPDTGAKLTLEKSRTDKVKISGLGDGKIAQDSNDAITGKQLEDLAGKLGVAVNNEKTGFTQPEFTEIKAGADPNKKQTTFKGAIDDLITAVNKGISFKGNDNASGTATMQLGGTLAFDSSGSANEKDITAKVTDEGNGNAKITLELNKANTVDENDERVVTSKAVADKLKNYTTTTALQSGFLKVDGTNIGDAEGKKTFGKNVGISEIKLGANDKSDTELVQAKALIGYLKGKGTNSVKISDSPETKAEGDNSISIGLEAITKNADSIAIGYKTNATNRKSLVLGSESSVSGEQSIAIGSKNDVSSNDSGVFGKENKISGNNSYALGAYNDIKGEQTYALGSNIKTEAGISNAVILGNNSKGEKDAVSVGSADKQRRIVYVATPTDKYDAVNKQYVDGLGLNFKGNDDKNIHKKLSQTLEIVGKGLNKAQTTKFNGTDGNIAVKENKGKLEISLNRDLKGIKSISDSKNKNIATEIRFNSKNSTSSIPNSLTNNLTISSNGGTFEFNRTGLHINNKQITGLRSGLLENHKGEDSDRKDLDYLIGGSFNASSIKTHAVNVGDLAKISKEIVEKGYKYNADIPSNNSNDTSIKLGSTISIVKWTDSPASGTGQPAVKYTGDNLTTRYTYDGGNAKIEIGFNESPTFKAVMLAENQTYNGGNAVGSKELITKGYLEQALDKFKFKVVNGDGKAIEIGRNDTLKFNAGLNIQLTLAKEGEKPANGATSASSTSAVTSTPAPTAPAVASSSDSSAPASTTSGSAGGAVASGGTNGDSADTVVASSSPTSGTSSTTTTTPSDTSTPTTTTPTTAVVTIGTTEDLKDITSISSKPKTAGGNGAGSTGEVTKLTLDPTDGATFQVGSQGAKVNINDKGIALMPQGASGMNNPNAESPSITINAGTKPADQSGLESFEKDQGPSIAFSTKNTDGKKIGSGKITGLADIKPDEKDGTLATNKNYVDGKVSDLNNNRPFDFYLNGEKVVKGADGNFHKADKPAEKLSEEEKKQVVIKAEPSTAPIGISNVASGLGITTPTDEQKEKLNQLAEEVSEKVTALGEKMKDFSEKAEKFADLQLMVDSLKQTVDTMPDGQAKEKMREDLKKYETQLSDAQEAKKNAKEAVESARNELIEANGDYNAFSEAIAKVEELVEPDSQAELSNVATIGDLQAVAKSGMKFKGNDGVEVRKQLSETLSITGEGTFNSNLTAAGNIKVEMAQDGKGLEVKLSDQLKNMTSFETREVNGKKARLDSNGLSVENTNTKERSHLSENRLAFFKDGALGLNLDGKDRALKVGEKAIISINGKNEALVEDLNASSSGQAIANKNYVDAKNNELRTQLHSVNRESRSGIAGANAAAALPMITMPGKSALAVSAGAYKGQSAVALGYSRMSDNGKIMLKLHGNSTSTGDFGGGVGIGWAW